jgi:hypothetical protein
LTRAKSGRISFLDVLSAVPPFSRAGRRGRVRRNGNTSLGTIRDAGIAGVTANRQFQLLVYACRGRWEVRYHIADYAEKIRMVAV